MHYRSLAALTAAALSLGLAGTARAGGYVVVNTGEKIVQAPSGQGACVSPILPLYAGANQHVGLVRDHVESAALYANHSTHYVRPGTPYLNKRPGRIDHNHSLLRAQRLQADLHALPTRVIGPLSRVERERTDRDRRPVLIMLKPDALPKRAPQEIGDPAIPSVPRHRPDADDVTPRLIAAAR